MNLKEVINEIRKIINRSLLDLEYDVIDYNVSEPPKSEFGDLTTNIAFLLGKKSHKKPYDIARELVYNSINIQLNNIDEDSLILNAEAHPSGHINFNINYKNFNNFILEIIKQHKLLFPDIGKNNKITIEHTSVNPNKALHIGHLRNVVLGDSLYRLFKLTNHETIVLNYIDDSGVQVADLIVAFKFAGFNSENIDKSIKFDQYCGDIYVKMNELYNTNLDLIEKRKFVIREIEKGDTNIAEFTNFIVEKIVKQQLLTCWRIKARYDILINESQILLSKLWKNTFNLLKDNNIINFSDKGKNINCWVIKDENNEEKVIVRSDRTVTYIAKDISFAVWKLNLVKDPFTYKKFSLQWDNSILWKTILKSESKSDDLLNNDKVFPFEQKPTIVITIIDSRQARLQKIISNIIEKIDHANNKKYVYLGYETVALSHETVQSIGFEFGKTNKKIIHMSGRKGIFINADNILDELYKKAYSEVKKRNPNWNDSLTDKIAEGIAVSAIRYNLIKQDLDRMITFDMKEALNLEGDTSLYLQYSFARAIRILEKGNEFFPKFIEGKTNIDIKLDVLNDKIEMDLIKEISKFDIVIEEAVYTLNPKVIAKYANKLSTKFNSFYESLPVLCDDSFLKVSRLLVVKVFVIILTNLFDLLGIQTLKRI
ncbi:MAG TPA: arginine--tRNA ligase [Nitrososphaeraceae archaeon]|nr:arginine--tRNA ligase [Nitrososphaeraceae archaeon]